MSRWSKCPGSVKLSQGLPNHTTKYAEEGTEAHELAANLLEAISQGKSPKAPAKKPTDEMLDYIKIYTDEVMRIFVMDPEAKLLIEHKFDLSSLFPGLFGTADAVIYLPQTKFLWVLDLKYGAGNLVEVEKNPQLMYYGLGALLSTKYPVKNVALTIVQPRAEHAQGLIRTHHLTALELLDFSADLVEFAEATEKPNAPIVIGSHCKFCPAQAVCPEKQKKAQELAKYEFGEQDVTLYSREKIAEILDAAEGIEAWVKAVREFAYQEAEHGRCPPGYKLVQKRATRKWKDQDATVKYLEWQKNRRPDEIFEPRNLKSPAQMDLILGKESKTDLAYLDLITAESSGNKLVHESEKGEPVKKLSAKEQFETVEN